jgi:hypothetical protein
MPSDPEARAIAMSWLYAPETLLCPQHAQELQRLHRELIEEERQRPQGTA